MDAFVYDAGRALIEASGWTLDAEIDISSLIDDLQKVGFDVPPTARQFLSRFWRLRLQHPPSVTIDQRIISCWTEFDPLKVCTGRDAEIARRCSELVDRELTPVGTDGFHMTIYITRLGEFYSGVDSFVFEYAENANDLFSRMASGVRPVLIAEWKL